MSRIVALLSLIVCLALAACGSDDKTKNGSAGATPETTATEPAAKSDCATVAAPKPKGAQHLRQPHLKLDRAKTYVVRMTTNCGEIDIRLDVKGAPKTAASVASLVKQGFYDNLTFHRISAPNGSDFVIQGGDPLGTGQGGPGYSVTERPPSHAQYTRGVVAMAKTMVEQPGTSGSQFFIVTAEDAPLPPDYAIAGKVVKGDDTVSKIAAVPADAQERPQAPVVIESAKLVER
jgi:cyclophilin family peptidyl-prolyl cis-trans isomerase